MGEVNTYKYITIFHSKIANSLWKMVRLTQKLAYMILIGIYKKMTWEIFVFQILLSLRQPKLEKMTFFGDWAAEPPNKIAKNQNFKNSCVSLV